jgi:dynein heavy chain
MLLILLSDFGDLIRPSPRHCLDQLNVLIPLIAEAKVDRLSQFVLDALQILRTDPQDTHAFVSQFEFRKRLIGDMEKVHSDYRDAAEFYTLINENNITTTDDATGAYRAAGSLIAQLETIMIKMQEEEDAKIKKWSPSVNHLLVKLRKELLDLHYATGGADVMQASTQMEPIIAFLKEKQEELSHLRERAETIQRYQRVLQLRVSPIDELTQVTRDLDLKCLLWTSLKEWKEKASIWGPTSFKALDVDSFTKDLEKFTRITSQLSSGLSKRPLAPVFKQLVMAYNTVLPVIVAIRNPFLVTSHWSKIEAIVGINKLDESNCPLSYLMERQIANHVDAVESIANDAANEAALLKMLKEIEISWDAIEFTMVPHKTIKEMYLMADIDDVVAHLDEAQVQLATIRSSRYVGGIKARVDDLSRAMNQLGKCLEYITFFQIAFNSLSKVFSSSDIQRELPTPEKDLVMVDHAFKLWGKEARDSPKVFKLCANQKAVA